MSNTTADILLDVLQQWEVEIIFGTPGDGISGLIEAINKRKDNIRFFQTRHEQASALMATCYARITGKLGVCLASTGSGGIHLLTGLYDAKLDGQPVLAITGSLPRENVDVLSPKDVTFDRLFMDVANYNGRIMHPAQAENITNLACRFATSRFGVAHIHFPQDLQREPVRGEGSRKNLKPHPTPIQRARVSHEGDLRTAAEILNEGQKIVILVGSGALGATEELELMAEILGAPVSKALLGKACLPDDHPYTTGGLGPLGTKPSLNAIQTCDTLLLVGTTFPYVDFLPKAGKVRAIQIDIDPTRIGLRYPVEVGLVGDCQRTLKQLLPLLEHHQNRSFIEKTQKNMRGWWKNMEEMGLSREKPLKPQVVAWELSRLLEDEAVVTCDAGTVAAWWTRLIKSKKGQIHAISGNLGVQGCGLPYAIAAQVAYPERQVVAFVGEEGFSMFMAEFGNCVKQNLPVKVVMIKSRSGERFSPSNTKNDAEPSALNQIDFSAFARACGATGFAISDPHECGAVLEEALKTSGPVLVEAYVDPHEPTGYISTTRKISSTSGELLVIDKESGKPIDLATISEKVREMIQGKSDS
jgi:pyruvate dehydrogenase (quinone)